MPNQNSKHSEVPTQKTTDSTFSLNTITPPIFNNHIHTRKTSSRSIRLMRNRIREMIYHNKMPPALIERYTKLRYKHFDVDEDLALLKNIYEQAGLPDLISVEIPCQGYFGWDGGDSWF